MSLPACCTDFDIDLTCLMFPDRLDADGWEFLQAFGAGNMTLTELQSRSTDLGDGKIKVHRRCAQLQDDGRCAIYATRPAICRDFDCSERSDCACQGRGIIG